MNARTILLTTLAMLAFAGNSILCRMALVEESLDPWSFTGLRLASGALALLPFLRGGRMRTSWSPPAALALFVYALGFSLAYVSLETGVGALLLFGSVQVTMLSAGWIQGERPSVTQVAGLILAALGVAKLLAPGLRAPEPLGASFMVAAGAAWGVYSLLGRRAERPAAATARNFVLCAPLGTLAMLVLGDGGALGARGILLAVASGALTSGLGYVLWYAALRGLSATSGSVVQLTVPVLAALGGVALLGEQLTPRLVVAGSLTLGGVLLAMRRVRRPSD